MTRSAAWAAALAAALLLGAPDPAAGLAPARRMTDYVHDVWRMADGLPQESVTAILQTRDGYLWLATLDGLARFDGVSFQPFNLIREAGIGSNVVTALVEDRDGTMWIGTTAGLLQYRDGRFSVFDTRHGLSDSTIRSLHLSRDGALLVGTRWGGLNRYAGGVFSHVWFDRGPNGDDVLGIAEDKSGTIWLATMAGLVAVRGDGAAFVRFDGHTGPIIVASVYVDRHDTIWVGTVDGIWALTAGERPPERSEPVVRRQFLPKAGGRAFHEDPQGTLWIGLSSGLARVHGETIEVADIRLLSHPSLRSFATDREGSLWIGTDGGGLNRLRDASVVMIENPSIDPHSSVMAVLRDPSGVMWTGSNCGGVTRWDAAGPTVLSIKNGLPSNCVRSLGSAPDGTVWVGTTNGVGVVTSRGITVYTTANGLSHNRVMAIAVDHEGATWLGTSGAGVDRAVNGRFTNYSTKDGLAHDDVRAILPARDGTLWFGTMGGGLSRWRNGRFETFAAQQGLSNNNVLALLEDTDGTLWVGTNGGGLNRLRQGRFTHYSTANGLFSDGIFQILDDGAGNLWMSCNRGVFRVSRQDLDDVAAGRRVAVISESFGQAEGLRPAGAMGGTQPAGAIDGSGRLWFPTVNAIATIDPKQIVRNRVPPPLHIARLTVDGQIVSGDALVRIPPGSRVIEIDYAGLSYVAPAKNRFRYRLVGFDEHWTDVQSRRTAYFTLRNHGHYRFEVTAANNDGVWSTETASVEFAILPRVYQTVWFYGGMILLAGAVVYAGVLLRERRLRAQARELKEQVDRSLAEIKVLSGLLPICASCKRIRDDDNQSWKPLEHYIHALSQASFSHGICPDCMKKLYPDY
ncbi:MAG: two-component regulator propeller domain-containing protein, partial [Vicinamibacterales bacterium]|nr:two-component regulator propeller domain-containing protein [Vicinamibacterales bacterium]